MAVAAAIEQAVQSPAGTGARRAAWLFAGAAPLLAGVGIAIVQPAPSLVSALTAVNVAVLVGLLGVSSYTDCLWRKIPNWATYTAFLWALAINAAATLFGVSNLESAARFPAPVGISESLFGAAAGFSVMLAVFRLAGSGAGDVKIAAALGGLLGAGPAVTVILWCHLAAAVFMVGSVVWETGPLGFLKTLAQHVGAKWFPTRIAAPVWSERKILCRQVPLAPFFAAGTIITFVQGPIL